MASRRELISLRMVAGEPVAAGGVTVTPQARVLRLRLRRGGLVWNMPAGVVVSRNGETRRIPVLDVTRIGQILLFAIGLGLAFAALWVPRAIARRRVSRESGV